MENRHRILLNIGAEIFRGPASETEGGRDLIDGFHGKHDFRIETLGADKGYFNGKFIRGLVGRKIKPHIAVAIRGKGPMHKKVRKMAKGLGYGLSQRARKKI